MSNLSRYTTHDSSNTRNGKTQTIKFHIHSHFRSRNSTATRIFTLSAAFLQALTQTRARAARIFDGCLRLNTIHILSFFTFLVVATFHFSLCFRHFGFLLTASAAHNQPFTHVEIDNGYHNENDHNSRCSTNDETTKIIVIARFQSLTFARSNRRHGAVPSIFTWRKFSWSGAEELWRTKIHADFRVALSWAVIARGARIWIFKEPCQYNGFVSGGVICRKATSPVAGAGVALRLVAGSASTPVAWIAIGWIVEVLSHSGT
mmetsp:Transcript_33644/g.69976  ORF Transcript_33644/g.69976 Transcript_33644/m.69976 type:complete len:261 (+) Transcript_33644:2016-2798(+)